MFEQKRAYWRSLDNAAKLFSAASSPKDTRVFRFYCELKEEVEENVLQEALDQTIEKYPVFLSVMRKGLFWHYLEKSELRPIVRKEYKEPCSSLYVRDKKTLLFEVTYYKKRINFEVFHALTDGTGATEFLREEIHARKELKKSQKILDHMGSTELAANLFRATQTEEKLRRENIQGKQAANNTHYEVGKKVRQTIAELGGTMPEDLPTPEKSIKQIEKEQKKLEQS